MFGSHLSISGGMHNALLKAEELGFDCVQVFTKNQQQWKCSPLAEEAIGNWKTHCTRLKFEQTVSHDSYLINLASPDEALRRKSIELFVEELSRCVILGIPYLVTHPGAHMGEGEEIGLRRVAQSLDVVHSVVPKGNVITCLEITAGQGSSLGYKLEHLAEIMSRERKWGRKGKEMGSETDFTTASYRRKPAACLSRRLRKAHGDMIPAHKSGGSTCRKRRFYTSFSPFVSPRLRRHWRMTGEYRSAGSASPKAGRP
jgi:hypothetical protein